MGRVLRSEADGDGRRQQPASSALGRACCRVTTPVAHLPAMHRAFLPPRLPPRPQAPAFRRVSRPASSSKLSRCTESLLGTSNAASRFPIRLLCLLRLTYAHHPYIHLFPMGDRTHGSLLLTRTTPRLRAPQTRACPSHWDPDADYLLQIPAARNGTHPLCSPPDLLLTDG